MPLSKFGYFSGIFLALLTSFISTPAFSYLQLNFTGDGGRVIRAKWKKNPVPFWIDPGGSGVPDINGPEVTNKSFSVWESVDTSGITFEYKGPAPDANGSGNITSEDMKAEGGNFSNDGRNEIIFDDTGQFFDESLGPGSNILGLAFPEMDFRTGEILDVDIVINVPLIGSSDLEGTMIHEIGHLAGLGHSPVFFNLNPGDVPTMYPFANPHDDQSFRTLETDDIAGISSIYPEGGFATSTSIVTGEVRKQDGEGAFGVHVMAYQRGTNVAVGGMSGIMEGAGSGRYKIEGLPQGNYTMIIQPVDGGPQVGGVSLEHINGIFNPGSLTGFPVEFFNNAEEESFSTILSLYEGFTSKGVDFVTDFENGGIPLDVYIKTEITGGSGGDSGCSISPAHHSVTGYSPVIQSAAIIILATIAGRKFSDCRT